MRVYKLKRIGQLLFTTGVIKGDRGVVYFTLLVDTGSTYTILPWEQLTTVGLESSVTDEKVQLTTASGIVIAPRIKTVWFSCLGLKLDSFPVVAHTLPLDLAKFSILGMDFMRRARVQIDVYKSQLKVALP
jgi:aspartyl protease family protein